MFEIAIERSTQKRRKKYLFKTSSLLKQTIVQKYQCKKPHPITTTKTLHCKIEMRINAALNPVFLHLVPADFRGWRREKELKTNGSFHRRAFSARGARSPAAASANFSADAAG